MFSPVTTSTSNDNGLVEVSPDRPSPVLESAAAILDGSADVPSDSEDRASDQEGKTGATASAPSAPATPVSNPTEMEEVPSSEYTDLDLAHPAPLPLSPTTLVESLDALSIASLPLPPSPASSTQSSSPELAAAEEQTDSVVETRKALMATPEKPQASEQLQDQCLELQLRKQSVAPASPVVQGCSAIAVVSDPVVETATPCHHLFEFAAPMQYEQGKWPKRFLAGRPDGGLRQRESSYGRLASKHSRRVVKIRATVQRPVKVETASPAEPPAVLPAPDAIAGHPLDICLPNLLGSSVSPANVCLPPSPDIVATPAAIDSVPEFMDLESIEEVHETVEQLDVPMVTPAVESQVIHPSLSPCSMALSGLGPVPDMNLADCEVSMANVSSESPPQDLVLQDHPSADGMYMPSEEIPGWTLANIQQAPALYNNLSAGTNSVVPLAFDFEFQLDPWPSSSATMMDEAPSSVPQTGVFEFGVDQQPPGPAGLQVAQPMDPDELFLAQELTKYLATASPRGNTQAQTVQEAEAPAENATPPDATAASGQVSSTSVEVDPRPVEPGESIAAVAAIEVETPRTPGPMLYDPVLAGQQSPSLFTPPGYDPLMTLATMAAEKSTADPGEVGPHPVSSSNPDPEPLTSVALAAVVEPQPDVGQLPAASTSFSDKVEEVSQTEPVKVAVDSSASPAGEQNGQATVTNVDKPATQAEIGSNGNPRERVILQPRFNKKRAAKAYKQSLAAGEGSSGDVRAPAPAVTAPAPAPQEVAADAPVRESTATSADNGNADPPAELDNSKPHSYHPSLPQENESAAAEVASTIPLSIPHNQVTDARWDEMLHDSAVKGYLKKLESVVEEGVAQLAFEEGIDERLPELWKKAALDEAVFLISFQWVSFAPGQEPSTEVLQKRANVWLDRVTQFNVLRTLKPEILRKHLAAEMKVQKLMT